MLQLHHRVRQEPQGPAGVAWRRLRAAQRHQVRLEVPVRLLRVVPIRNALLQRYVLAILDEASLHAIELLQAHRKDFGKLLARLLLLLQWSLVAAQQDQRVEHRLAAVLAARGDLLKQPPLLFGQHHLVPEA